MKAEQGQSTGIGTIVKGVGGFYSVRSEEGEAFTLRARGRFRIQGIAPIIGDKVAFDKESKMMLEILPRSNVLNRPRIANATSALIVASLKKPDIAYPLLDKILIQNASSGLESSICFNKTDLSSPQEEESARKAYEKAGAKAFFASALKGEGISQLEAGLKGKITIFTGVSGSGKSTIVSILCPNEIIASQEVSRKIGRGKNTTRHIEIYISRSGDLIADTPGFSMLDLAIPAESVWKYYPEFYDYSDCRFDNCLHLSEPGCSVRAACEEGLISQVRFGSYEAITRGLLKSKGERK